MYKKQIFFLVIMVNCISMKASFSSGTALPDGASLSSPIKGKTKEARWLKRELLENVEEEIKDISYHSPNRRALKAQEHADRIAMLNQEDSAREAIIDQAIIEQILDVARSGVAE